MSSPETVLITGGTGIASCRYILEALKRSLRVRTTVRSPRRVDELHQILRAGGASSQQIADINIVLYNELFSSERYAELVDDCSFIVHSIPYGNWDIRHMSVEDSISLATDPVLKLLNAAKSCNPKCKVVIINSITAVTGDKPSSGHYHTEVDWPTTNTTKQPNLLAQRQNIAVATEKALWDWHASEGKGMHVTVLEPPNITGLCLHKIQAKSQVLLLALLKGTLSEGFDHPIGVIDPRDLTDLVFRCLDSPGTAGERYIACPEGDLARISDHVRVINSVLSTEEIRKVSYSIWSPWLMKLARLMDVIPADVARAPPKSVKVSIKKAKNLGWNPRPSDESIIEGVKSLREFGVLPSQNENQKHKVVKAEKEIKPTKVVR